MAHEPCEQLECIRLRQELQQERQRADKAEVALSKAQKLVVKLRTDRDAWIDKSGQPQSMTTFYQQPQPSDQDLPVPRTDWRHGDSPGDDSSGSVATNTASLTLRFNVDQSRAPISRGATPVDAGAHDSEAPLKEAGADVNDEKPTKKRARSSSLAKKATKATRASDGNTAPKAKRTKNMAPVDKPPAKIPAIKRDSEGRPILPVVCGLHTLHSLGEIVNLPNFQTERYIYTDGWLSSRSFLSTIRAGQTTTYFCRILRNGDSPVFQIEPEDNPAGIVHASTATGAWSQIFKAAHSLRDRLHSNSVSGPSYYGSDQNLFKAMLQELPGASELSHYVQQQFIEITGRERASRASVPMPTDPAPPAQPQPMHRSYSLPPLAAPSQQEPYMPFFAATPPQDMELDASSYYQPDVFSILNDPLQHFSFPTLDQDPFAAFDPAGGRSRRSSFDEWTTPPSRADVDFLDTLANLPPIEHSATDFSAFMLPA